MFTYPIVSPGGFATEEYVLLNNPTLTYYMSVGPGTSELIASANLGAALNSTNFTTNGTHLIHVDYDTVYGIRILQWDGSTGFTEVGSCFTMPDGVASGGCFDPVFDANGDYVSTKFIAQATDPRAGSVFTLSGLAGTVTCTQDEVSYYTGISPLTTPSWVAGPGMDFRRGAAIGKPGYGDIFVGGTTTLNSEAASIYTVENGLITWQGYGPSGSSPFGNMQYVGWDRDNHFMVSLTTVTLGSEIYYWDVDLDTPSIGSRSTLTVPSGDAILAAAAVDGFIVLWEEDGSANSYLRTYSKSGTTLTQISSVAIPGNSTRNASLAVSPHTKYVYNWGGNNGTAAFVASAWSVNKSTGELSKVTDLAVNILNTSGQLRKGFEAFLEPLPSAP